jgi:hypothetical protein
LLILRGSLRNFKKNLGSPRAAQLVLNDVPPPDLDTLAIAWTSTTRAVGASAQGARADPTAATHPKLRTKDSCTRQRCGDPGGLADPDQACRLEPQTNWHPPADQVLATHTASRTRCGRAAGPRGLALHTFGSTRLRREAGSPRCEHRDRRRRRNQTPSCSACSGTVQRAQQLEQSRSSRHRRGNCRESASRRSFSRSARAVQRLATHLPPAVDQPYTDRRPAAKPRRARRAKTKPPDRAAREAKAAGGQVQPLVGRNPLWLDGNASCETAPCS